MVGVSHKRPVNLLEWIYRPLCGGVNAAALREGSEWHIDAEFVDVIESYFVGINYLILWV